VTTRPRRALIRPDVGQYSGSERRDTLVRQGLDMAPGVGLEPTTNGLTVRYSPSPHLIAASSRKPCPAYIEARKPVHSKNRTLFSHRRSASYCQCSWVCLSVAGGVGVCLFGVWWVWGLFVGVWGRGVMGDKVVGSVDSPSILPDMGVRETPTACSSPIHNLSCWLVRKS
jgi:hypothetical protein